MAQGCDHILSQVGGITMMLAIVRMATTNWYHIMQFVSVLRMNNTNATNHCALSLV